MPLPARHSENDSRVLSSAHLDLQPCGVVVNKDEYQFDEVELGIQRDLAKTLLLPLDRNSSVPFQSRDRPRPAKRNARDRKDPAHGRLLCPGPKTAGCDGLRSRILCCEWGLRGVRWPFFVKKNERRETCRLSRRRRTETRKWQPRGKRIARAAFD